MRKKVFCLLLSIAVGLFAPLVVAVPGGSTWDFRVFLDDKEIGSHRFDIVDNGGARTLTSTARFNVRFLFVTAYSYDHKAVEGWDGNCLASLESYTDDNGKIHQVEARQQSKETIVETRRGKERHDECIMTFAYWNPAMLKQSRLLNSQNGEYLDVTITDVGTETISVRGAAVPARHYALRSKGMAIELWYSNDDQWLALESVTEGGRRLSYRLR